MFRTHQAMFKDFTFYFICLLARFIPRGMDTNFLRCGEKYFHNVVVTFLRTHGYLCYRVIFSQKSKSVPDYNKKECIVWLKNLGLSTSGTKKELQAKILKFQSYLNLVSRLEKKTQRNFSFPCSIKPINIPELTANRKVSDELLPVVTEQICFNYASLQKERNDGQQQKAFKMFQSRKIVSVTVLTQGSTLFVKAIIKGSYGQQAREAIIYFEGSKPQRAHYYCPIGASGLRCHTLAVLMS